MLINGKRAAITDARFSYAPRRVVVLLDLSGSMAGETSNGKWRIAEEAVSDLLSEAPGESPIAVVTFASGIQRTFDFGESRTAVASWLKENPDRPPKLKGKKTALFDAIVEGQKLLAGAQPGDAIVAITDGDENASRASAKQTEAALLQSGARLFVLLFGGYDLRVPREGRYAFLDMVRDSGGFSFELVGRHIPGLPVAEYPYDTANRENAKSYTTELNTLINEFWTLDLAGAWSPGKSKIKIEVTDRSGKERKDVVVIYPRVLSSPN